MASTATVAPPPVLSTGADPRILQEGVGTNRENPRSGRGGSRGAHNGERHRGERGRGRGQRGMRGNGRGNQRARRQSNGVSNQAPLIPPPPDLNVGGTSSGRSTRDAEMKEGEVMEEKQQDEGTKDVEAEVCFICASRVIHNSVAPCNHRTCHICALRLRALYKTRACAHCRVSFAPSPSRTIIRLTICRQRRNL